MPPLDMVVHIGNHPVIFPPGHSSVLQHPDRSVEKHVKRQLLHHRKQTKIEVKLKNTKYNKNKACSSCNYWKEGVAIEGCQPWVLSTQVKKSITWIHSSKSWYFLASPFLRQAQNRGSCNKPIGSMFLKNQSQLTTEGLRYFTCIIDLLFACFWRVYTRYATRHTTTHICRQ